MGQMMQALKAKTQKTSNPFVKALPTTPPAVAVAMGYNGAVGIRSATLDQRFPAACLHYTLAMEGV